MTPKPSQNKQTNETKKNKIVKQKKKAKVQSQ